MKKTKWKRNCPESECGIIIYYSFKYVMNRAIKENRVCRSCSKSKNRNPMFGKNQSENAKQKMKGKRVSITGKNHPLYGKPRTNEVKQKIRKNNKSRTIEVRNKIKKNHSNYWIGRNHTEKTKKKQRLSAIKRIENQNGQCIPNYNPNSIKFLEQKAKELGITDLQDAETPGGEFQVCGYFVDGYSPSKNIVIEYYEPFHRNQVERDERRKNEIIKELGCKFIEIKEWKL